MGKEEMYKPWLYRMVLAKELNMRGAHLRMLDTLLGRMEEDGTIRESTEQLASYMGLSRSRCFRAIRDLQEWQLLRRVDSRGWIVDPQMYWQGSKRELRRLKARFEQAVSA